MTKKLLSLTALALALSTGLPEMAQADKLPAASAQRLKANQANRLATPARPGPTPAPAIAARAAKAKANAKAPQENRKKPIKAQASMPGGKAPKAQTATQPFHQQPPIKAATASASGHPGKARTAAASPRKADMEVQTAVAPAPQALARAANRPGGLPHASATEPVGDLVKNHTADLLGELVKVKGW